jgi:hypothetical protein
MPEEKSALHTPPQLMPGGLLVTVPLPVLAGSMLTARLYWFKAKVADMLCVAVTLLKTYGEVALRGALSTVTDAM